ncbi:MAG: hypothetical protein H6Q02_1631 [Acidobacteria bacterium]|nr:hypothetical protein [Acidobacteriota bacterium]
MTDQGWPTPVVRERTFVFSGGTTMKKLLVGCGLVTALVMAALVAGVVWLASSSTVDGVVVGVEGPVAVTEGEEYTLVLTIRNESGREQRLVDLDIADSYLDGVVLQSSEPPFSSSQHVPVDRSVSHSYDRSIPAGGTLSIRLQALALRPGDFAGDFDLCINHSYACLPHHVRTVIRPAGPVPRAPETLATPPPAEAGAGM